MRLQLAVMLFLTTSPLRAQTFQHSYAVIVGISTYASVKALPNAQADAESIASLLRGQQYEVTELYNQSAGRAAILEAMDNVARVANDHDRVLFFFAGHGYTETRGDQDWGYIVPFDGKPGATYTLIGMEELRTQSQRMGRAHHQLFLIDSCYGGSIGIRDSPGGVDPRIPNYLSEITKRVAREALTAGGKDQQVEDGSRNGHSRFTATLLEALQEGNADLNADGYITFSELSAYVIPRATSRLQTPEPSYLPGHGQGEYWFVSPVPAKAVIPSLEPSGARRTNTLAADSVHIDAPSVTGSDRLPIFNLQGIRGFKPIPDDTHGFFVTRHVFSVGSDVLEAQGRNATIRVLYEGRSIGTLDCKNVSVQSWGERAVDMTGAFIPAVDHVRITSSGGSIEYYSKKLSSDEKKKIQQGLNGICWR